MIQIIGKGGFGREVACYLKGESRRFFEHEEINEANDFVPTVIAIGDPNVREKIAKQFPNLKYTNLFRGQVFDTETFVTGKGNIICPGTILTTNIVLGDHVIINLNCTVGHDVFIRSFTTLSPGANISGKVYIGTRCYIGSNAVIREGINICNDVIIGAGAVVVKNISEPGTYVGNPVRNIKGISVHDIRASLRGEKI